MDIGGVRSKSAVRAAQWGTKTVLWYEVILCWYFSLNNPISSMQGPPRQSYRYTRQSSSATSPWATIESVSLTSSYVFDGVK